MDDGHFISFATIMLTIVTVGILAIGGTITFLTLRSWDKQKDPNNSNEPEEKN